MLFFKLRSKVLETRAYQISIIIKKTVVLSVLLRFVKVHGLATEVKHAGETRRARQPRTDRA